MTITHIGNREVDIREDRSVCLYDIIQRKRVNKFFKSVWIHRDGTAAIEEYDGNYQKAYGASEKRFQMIREQIHKEIARVTPLLNEIGYFTDKAVENMKFDYMEVVFYSNIYDHHLYDAIYFDNDLHVVGHYGI